MGSSGIRRKVDDLGRVVIPAGIRRALNIREGDAVEVFVEGERVVLTKPRNACSFCGREDDRLPVYRSRRVCEECLGSLARLDEQVRAGSPVAPAPPDPQPPSPQGDDRRTDPPPGRRPIPPRRHPEPSRSGPIDGDALARTPAPDRARPPDGGGRPAPPGQDPASTTAW